MASPPGASVIDFVSAIADGLTSPQLAKLKPGDSITITQPASGFFTLDEVLDGDDLWLLSTGTGIGPYIQRTGGPGAGFGVLIWFTEFAQPRIWCIRSRFSTGNNSIRPSRLSAGDNP